jgi:hypothetical protein
MLFAITALLIDLKLRGFWFARGLIVALGLMFGVILKEYGFDTATILISWCILYVAKGLSFLSVDSLSPERQHRISNVACFLAIGCAVLMAFVGINLVVMSAFIVLLQPAIREAIHDGTVYVRERGDWPLGVDVASALSNEIGKSLGAALISVVGLLMAMGVSWLMVGLAAFSLIIIWGHQKPALPDISSEKTPARAAHPRIGPVAKGFLCMSFIHNGVFFAIQSFLSLALYDLLVEGGFGADIIGTLGLMLTAMMIIGLMVFSWFRKRAGTLTEGHGRSPMLGFALGSLALLASLSFVVIGLWQSGLIGSGLTALLIGTLMGMLMAFGGFFTLGALQLLDAIYRHKAPSERNECRKRVLHLNMMICQFSPAMVLLGIYGASLHFETLSDLAYIVTGLIAAVEGMMVLFCLSLSRAGLNIQKPITASTGGIPGASSPCGPL